MRRVGKGAENPNRNKADNAQLEKEIGVLKEENRQLKAENKQLKAGSEKMTGVTQG